MGEIEVECDFAFSYPEIYQYMGAVTVNDEYIHYFEYTEPEV